MKTRFTILIICITLFTLGCKKVQKFKPDWESLKQNPTPKWLQEGKFGIYTHWGIYAVHAFGSNTTWYSNSLYANPNGPARKHFEETFGKLTPEFGYKDLIPMFKAEKFNADEWAELFQKAGAKFAGPVAEHHDGFAMWDTKYSKWNAAKMGPKRDVVGELEKAIKKRNMKFVTAFHHAENWIFFPVWDKRYDTGNPKYSSLYGQFHEQGAMPPAQESIDEWYNKIIEVIDKYGPDFIWFDFGLDYMPEGYVKDFLAYYYNYAQKKGKEVVVTYKDHDIIPGAGIRDLELGQSPDLAYYDWITDSSVDDRGAWGWANDLTYKPANRLIDNLIDNVSKNGYLLLNVGPKPDGTIPDGAKKVLLEMGSWLETNGEAIYSTTPWFIFGEGPTNIGQVQRQGFNESAAVHTPEDIRFTVKGDVLYATFLDWPGETAIIKTIRAIGPEAVKVVVPEWAKGEVKSLAGTEWDLAGLRRDSTTKYHYVFKENGEFHISGGSRYGAGVDGKYEQVGSAVYLSVGGSSFEGKYDGDKFTRSSSARPNYPGFYKEEIKRITMLGDGKDLEWVMTKQGLTIETPEKKGNYAYVFKIERYHHPKLK
jgi:alpha-L-fucosidase